MPLRLIDCADAPVDASAARAAMAHDVIFMIMAPVASFDSIFKRPNGSGSQIRDAVSRPTGVHVERLMGVPSPGAGSDACSRYSHCGVHRGAVMGLRWIFVLSICFRVSPAALASAWFGSL